MAASLTWVAGRLLFLRKNAMAFVKELYPFVPREISHIIVGRTAE
jgi:hypothetical protein